MLQFYSHHVLFSLKEVYYHSFSKLVVVTYSVGLDAVL